MKELPEKEQQQRPKLQGSEQPKKQKDKDLRQKESGSKICPSQEEGREAVKLCDLSKINHILDKSISINMQFSS